MVSKCREGLGSETFLTQLSSSNDPKIVLENIKREYKLGYHKTAKMAEIMVNAEVGAVTDLNPEILSKANITPFKTVQEAIDSALEKDPDAEFIVLMEGSVTVPRVE